jgi:glyoxylase-like metal-dependent hydrolase (beta-lactamase superfamily II)
VRIVPLLTGRVAIHRSQLHGRSAAPVNLVRTLADPRWSDWLPVWSWAIEHPEGTIVVDAGMDAAWQAPWWDAYARFALRARVGAQDALAERLREHGIDPAAVTRHVFTHLHIDHVGAFGTLPNAEVVVGAAEWGVASSRTGRLKGLIVPRPPARLTVVDFDAPGLRPFPYAHALTGDGAVLLLPTPGHSPGHLSVLVRRDADRVLLTGDAVYSERQLQAGAIDGIAIDTRAAHDSVRRLRELTAQAPTVVAPSHDPDAAARLGT